VWLCVGMCMCMCVCMCVCGLISSKSLLRVLHALGSRCWSRISLADFGWSVVGCLLADLRILCDGCHVACASDLLRSEVTCAEKDDFATRVHKPVVVSQRGQIAGI